MGPCKLHVALSVDVLCTKICFDGFNRSEHPKIYTLLVLRARSHAVIRESEGQLHSGKRLLYRCKKILLGFLFKAASSEFRFVREVGNLVSFV